MKRTISINLGSTSFTIDNDAYIALENYLEDIKSRLGPYENWATLQRVESRIADIIRNTLLNDLQVVTLEMVLRSIAIIGPASSFNSEQTASNFDDRKTASSFDSRQRAYNHKKKLSRSNSNVVLGGVCAGVAEFCGVDPLAIRLLTFILFFVGGFSFLVYVILWIIIPRNSDY